MVFGRIFLLCVLASLSVSAEVDSQDIPWVSQPSGSYSSQVPGGFSLNPKIGEHPILGFPLLVGSLSPGFFLPIVDDLSQKVWWNTGTLLFGSSLGYRKIPKQPLFNKKWFWGIYTAHELIVEYDSAFRGHIGAEIVSAHFGEFIINGHNTFINPSDMPNAQRQLKSFGVEIPSVVSPMFILDNWGVNCKFSYPIVKRLTGSILLAYSRIWEQEDSLKAEGVWSFGVGAQGMLSARTSVQFEYTLIDKYRKGTFYIGFRYGRGDNNLSKDVIKSRLSRPPEITAPLYMPSFLQPGALDKQKHTFDENNEKRLAKQYAQYVSGDPAEIAHLSSEALNRRYRKDIQKFHPDRGGDPELSAEFTSCYQSLIAEKNKKS